MSLLLLVCFSEACLKFPPADDLLLAATTWVCSPEATFVQNQRLWDAVAQAVGVLKGPAVTPTCPGRTQLRGGQICLGCPRDGGEEEDYPAGHWAASKQVRIQVRRDRLCWDVQGFAAYYFKSISVGVPPRHETPPGCLFVSHERSGIFAWVVPPNPSGSD